MIDLAKGSQATVSKSRIRQRAWRVRDVRHVRELFDDIMETRLQGVECASTACRAINSIWRENEDNISFLRHELQMMVAENQYYQDHVTALTDNVHQQNLAVGLLQHFAMLFWKSTEKCKREC